MLLVGYHCLRGWMSENLVQVVSVYVNHEPVQNRKIAASNGIVVRDNYQGRPRIRSELSNLVL